MSEPLPYSNIDEYIAQFPEEIQQKMQAVRNVIRETAPEATEKISWAMPTFYLNGNLVHFAAGKSHLGLYPGESGISHFTERFDAEGFKYSKGAVQFPYKREIPFELIKEIVALRVKENTAKG